MSKLTFELIKQAVKLALETSGIPDYRFVISRKMFDDMVASGALDANDQSVLVFDNVTNWGQVTKKSSPS